MNIDQIGKAAVDSYKHLTSKTHTLEQAKVAAFEPLVTPLEKFIAAQDMMVRGGFMLQQNKCYGPGSTVLFVRHDLKFQVTDVAKGANVFDSGEEALEYFFKTAARIVRAESLNY